LLETRVRVSHHDGNHIVCCAFDDLLLVLLLDCFLCVIEGLGESVLLSKLVGFVLQLRLLPLLFL
jgi:hypothetical protein